MAGLRRERGCRVDKDILSRLRTAPTHDDWFCKCMEASGRPGRKLTMNLCILYRDRNGVREFYPGGGGGWPTDVRLAKLVERDAESTLDLMVTYGLQAAFVEVRGIKVVKPWFVARFEHTYLHIDLTLDEDGEWYPTESADPMFFDSEDAAREKLKDLFDEQAVKVGLSTGNIRIEQAREDT